MQTQNKNSIESQQHGLSVEPRKSRRWLAGLSAFVVVLLVVGASIFVFAAARQRQGSQQPPIGQWEQVQSGYLFLSMKAAPSNPAVLYSCVTTSAAVSNKEGQADTILRSADAGSHWQNIGTSAGLGSYCDLTVSPTNENDIYVISTGVTSQTNATLRHSTDGGQTWTTITPTFSPELRIPGTGAAGLPWFVQQLSYDGHSLYGIQWVATRSPAIQGPPTFSNRLPRLVTSADGGYTWHIIDGQFTAQNLGAQSYTLDATHPGTIYEIVGQTLFPIETLPVPTNGIVPRFVLNQQLFKSTDNGASWQSLLTGLPFGSQAQLASANPQIVYVGGIRGPLPLVSQYPPNERPVTTNQPTIAPGVFHLQVSTSGGASWQQVADPSEEQFIQDWFVSADGSVYTSPTISSGSPGVGPSAVAGTAVPATPVYSTPLPV
ncbi:MAG TPA: sialidase family protein, partial [Ktedonobacteraceae bacterium]